ncbi:hypothetical protein MUN81_15240 [Hymenobacter sp. 5317J-9]|uniref:hypothetical protein n=1 Tax=Hymenobacter sp. 5317J-9 TaxID=2932250 RepID=UPI001FD6936C|nr:hypothetical protein [Hymenobacter sp. 5317J-9]UOQ96590.1 hypothetical protein MUN81_15240 [Hymenobacter sp. 5317J-9]
MQEKQFNLILTSRWRATLVAFAIVIAFVWLLVGALNVFSESKWLGSGSLIMVISGFVFLPEIIARKFSAKSAVVRIDAEGLSVHYIPGISRRINFADMAYYYSDLNHDFNVQPHRGGKLILHLNAKLHPHGITPLAVMWQHFEKAVAIYQQQHPENSPIRKLGYFDRPLATFWLVIFAVILVGFGWRAFQPFASEAAWGGFLLGCLGFSVYALLWRRHRKAIRQ